MQNRPTIAVLGTGQMARALVHAWIQANLVQASQILGSDPNEEARNAFTAQTRAPARWDNLGVTKEAQIVLLAVKPPQILSVLQEIRPAVTKDHLILSIAAGVPTRKIEQALFDGVRVIRVMPNTPALVGCMAGAYCQGRWAKPEDTELTQRLFSALGVIYEVNESLLDAVTGLSGSGPAFIALVIEALADGGVAAGLPREMALRLACQTVQGTAKLIAQMNLHPAQLKDMVASPAGTTIAGLEVLESHATRAAFLRAVRRAAERSKELGQEK